MVQFGKKLRESLHTDPWQDHYLDYGSLKKLLKFEQAGTATSTDGPNLGGGRSSNDAGQEASEESSSSSSSDLFRPRLDREIEKVVLFFLQKQGELASTLSCLRDTQAQLEGKFDAVDFDGLVMEAGYLADIRALASAYRSVGEELVRFVQYVEWNVVGLRKILKKHDKKCAGRLGRRKLANRYLSPYMDGSDSHLQQLYHYEGMSALVVTIRSSLSELKVVERAIVQHVEEAAWGEADEAGGSTTQLRRLSLLKTELSISLRSEDDDYEPILNKIERARRCLHQSTLYVKALAAHALVFDGSSLSEDECASEDEGSFLRKERRRRLGRTPSARISSLINLMSTGLYMMNYYIIVPTSGRYAKRLGSTEALSGIVIGMTPVAAMVSAVLYSWWANRSYKGALLFASGCSIAGNVLYALALPCDSLNMVLAGRLLNGFGGARAINRRYIADAYHWEERTAASAAFVTAGALGMAAGPAVAAVLGYNKSEYSTLWTVETSPGWFMSVLWITFFLCTVFFFEEPERIGQLTRNAQKKKEKDVEPKETSPMLPNNAERVVSYSAETNATPPKHQSTSSPLYKNIPVMTTLVIYFVLKLVLECLLSSATTVTSFYFRWDITVSAIYLAFLGLLMFPANICLANLSYRGYDDRDLILSSLVATLVGILGIICYRGVLFYTAVQYVAFGMCIFVSTNILEGVNMSLLSKTIPRSLAKGTFNSGLLATEAGTFGRVVGDVLISATGIAGLQHVLNYTFAPLGLFVFIAIVITWRVYPDLEPKDDDDDDE